MSNNEEHKEIPYGNVPSPVESMSSEVSEVVLWSEESNDSDGLDSTVKSMLDYSSPTFSPTFALACSSVAAVPVVEGADIYLNLQQYGKAIQSPSKTPKKDVASVKQLTMKELEAKASTSKVTNVPPAAATPQFPIPGRRFLPHQLPVFRPRKEHPNTLTLMDTVEGPLSVLRRVMTENVRIKLWTRSDKGFRGFLTGFVEAFDKHWNISLRDVDEQFVRKKVIKFPIIGDSLRNPEERDDNDKEAAISSAFIRLKNYLRQNDETKHTGSTAKRPKTTYRNSKKMGASHSSEVVTRSKNVFIGDMDPLSICRTGLAKLSLLDDNCLQDLTSKSAAAATSLTSPDIVQCHQSSSSGCAATASTESSTSAARPIQPNISKTLLKKKSLTVFKTPYEDNLGFFVVAQTKKYELVERHVGQVLLMGNDIVFIETSGC